MPVDAVGLVEGLLARRRRCHVRPCAEFGCDKHILGVRYSDTHCVLLQAILPWRLDQGLRAWADRKFGHIAKRCIVGTSGTAVVGVILSAAGAATSGVGILATAAGGCVPGIVAARAVLAARRVRAHRP